MSRGTCMHGAVWNEDKTNSIYYNFVLRSGSMWSIITASLMLCVVDKYIYQGLVHGKC